MTTEPQVRYYLGANSPGGFYSLYDQLLDPGEAEELLILKGGPGCGKSTLMGQVAARAEEQGLRVEYIRCSGDPDSLDAILLPDRRAAIVDGTAPHVVEPRLPGAVERYVDLGACYDHAGLRKIRGELEGAMKGYKDCYARAYRCLRAAAELTADRVALLQTPELEAKMAKRAKGILSRECRRSGGGEGKVRQRFLSAVTHQGLLTEFGTVERQCRRVYELADTYGLGHLLLTHLLAGALAAGWDVIACPSPLFPDRLEHLMLPQLSLAFVTTGGAAVWPHRPYRRLRMDAMADRELLQRNKARLSFSRKVSAALLDEAVSSLAQAKAMHDDLERLYNPYVDFGRVRTTAEWAAAELLSHRAEHGRREESTEEEKASDS